MPTSKDGYMPFMEYKTYFRIFGKPNPKKSPLLVLHGGPGSSHHYLLVLAELAKSGRQIIFYDQLGGGLSDRPLNNRIWSMELFVKELEAIREFLKLDKIILYGHSWGGMLAAEYMCASVPKGVDKVIFASSMVSMPLYRIEVDILKKDLPADIYKMLSKHEKAGTTDSDEYHKAMAVYNKRHILKSDKMPVKYQSPPNSFGTAQYEKLWGVSEAYPDGVLKNWSRLEDLNMVKCPALVISGQYDELTPRQALATAKMLPDATVEIITGGTHLAHIEYPDTYLTAIAKFID
ncbi:MAG TPA: proline iminopeptidase-family hydrolase [Candidatus Saccharimonadales bacterium]|nr:proline iminopeptidase-family hydrolase [Candidatus Saccharimonadales bacterium]